MGLGRGGQGADPAGPPTALLLHRYVVARVIWADMLSIAVTYFITLCLFPGLESEIRHCVLGEWLPILLMAVFNLSDFVGKVGAAPPRRGGGCHGGGGQQTARAASGATGMSLGRAGPELTVDGARGPWVRRVRAGHHHRPQLLTAASVDAPGQPCVPEAGAGSGPPGAWV